MDVREKLVELIFDSLCRHIDKSCKLAENIADDLISNGVTVQENVEIRDELLKQLKNAPITICKEEPSIELVQEWVSVDDRLPEEKVKCIVRYKHAYCDNDDYWAIGISFYDGKEFQIGLSYKVTHWQYLPKPPKGE